MTKAPIPGVPFQLLSSSIETRFICIVTKSLQGNEHQFKHGGKPRLACEISADRILAGRAADAAAAWKFVRRVNWLRAAWFPTWSRQICGKRGRVRQAIEETLGAVGGRAGDVIAVLP